MKPRPTLSRDAAQLLITAALCSPGVGVVLSVAGVLLMLAAEVLK